MSGKPKQILVIAAMLGLALATVSARRLGAEAGQASPAGGGSKTAAQQFKNIQILKDVPADQIIPTMQFISASLGVECDFCHVQNAFDKDDKETKKTARKMITMMMAINKDNFDGHREVTCYTCHHGSNDPASTPIISDEEPKPEPPGMAGAPGGAAASAPAGPTAEQVLDKYVQSVGGTDALHKISTRAEKGNITFMGHAMPAEVYAKAPDKRVAIMHMPQGESYTAYDGQVGWLANMGRPAREISGAELDAMKLDADFYFAADAKQVFQQLRAGRPDKIGDKEAYVLIGITPGQPPVRLYFDQESGLLLRQLRFAETPLGRNPTRIDYADYREADGVKIPFRWTIARPGGRFTIQIEQVQSNVPIEDSKFAEPPKPAAPADKPPSP
ncbi:MAG TPA: c-type cytochrome [Terriglobia bacterium]